MPTGLSAFSGWISVGKRIGDLALVEIGRLVQISGLPIIPSARSGSLYLSPGRFTPDLLFTGCLETHNSHPPKISEHLTTHSNSHSKGAQNTLTKIMLGDVARVSDLETLRQISSQ